MSARRGLLKWTVVGFFVLAVLWPPHGRAASSPCQSPRCIAQSLTFRGGTYRFNVVVPTGYSASSVDYPVLYLMGGLGNNQDSWLIRTDLLSFTANQPVIVVLLDGDPSGLHIDYADGSYYWESFIFSSLLPYIDSRYRTIAGRAHRAIAGLSGGGFAAAHLAARHPDDFVAVGGFSGFVYDVSRPSPAAEVVLSVIGDTPPPLPNPADLFPFEGDPLTNDTAWHNHNPAELATNLHATSLYLAVGDQVPCNQQDIAALLNSNEFPSNDFEAVAFEQTHDFDQTLTGDHIVHTSDFYGCGIHTWPYWQRDLHTWWPKMKASFGSPAPARFDYRTADPTFSVWGWTFLADPHRAPEFLDTHTVSCSGMTITGSGTAIITTPPCFRPGETIRLSGTQEPSATAAADGTITFHVQLGQAHRYAQYSPQERLLEAAGNYFSTRVITIQATGGT